MKKSRIEINENEILIENATIHNIKNLSIKIPLHKFVTIIGQSGSGKSSLIYDFFFKNYENNDLENKINSKIYALKQKNYLSKNSTQSSGKFILTKFNEIKNKLKENDILILDEPCSGLNEKDTLFYVNEIKELLKNKVSVLVIEHNKFFIPHSEYFIEFGPEGGEKGGKIIFEGSLNEFKKSNLISSKLIFEKEKLIEDKNENKQFSNLVKIEDINKNNLKNFKISFPLYNLTTICGNIGSGKSTLLEYIYKSMYKGKDAWKIREDIDFDEKKITGKQNIRRSYIISQNHISNNPNSIVASYINILNEIRNIFSNLDESKKLKLTKQAFEIDKNLNVKNVDSKILGIKISDLNIYDILNLTIDEVYNLFKENSIIKRKLEFLKDLDLGYLVIGQKSFTLSGGEAQRIKLAKILTKKLGDRCLYLLDTPSKGLHIKNLDNLLNCFRKIIDKKNTIIIVENNIKILNESDYIIKL